ncbi:MAG TPA: hypothetical protein VKU80_01235 [Planctomycetota bacterium]|nr:hypothetical protein [Planctomycetota bacterium]
MDSLPKRRIWLPPIEALIFLGVGLVVAAIAIPGLLSSQRASNERAASTNLKVLTSAEADFRANDRDGNHVNDFWTGDVSGLYYVKSAESGKELHLIEQTQANADPKALFPLLPRLQPMNGYWFAALERDAGVAGSDGLYKRDTDKTGRKVHNEGKFGFCAFPVDRGAGKFIFFVNENNTIFREAGFESKDAFPDDSTLKSYWTTTN